FSQPFAVNVAFVNALTTLPQNAAKFAKAFKQHHQITLLHITAGPQPPATMIAKANRLLTGLPATANGGLVWLALFQ
ncbi:hypothetical protein AAIH56_35895, partial [Pseudomonas aeruginosa]|uniref:hypothetical protein n=1 Tax=Pseudomonas aeruginosa TaxID=287 RepID=UPI0031B7E416